MKRFLSVILAAMLLLGCMGISVFAEGEPASGYSLFVVIDGLNNEAAGTAAVTHVQSETPNYVLPGNPKTVKEGYTFKGYSCKETGKTYQIGDTIPLADFTEKTDGYWIYLHATFSENEKPGIEYTDVYRYRAELNILYPDDYQGLDNIFETIDVTYDPAKNTNVGTVDYTQKNKQGRPSYLAQFVTAFGVAPEGYRSAVTGNIFELDGTYDLDKLPETAYVGTTLTDDGTNGQRIHEYVITDYLIPIYSYFQVTGAFYDPLYECEIDYYVPSPISDNENLNAPVSYVGKQTFTDLTMADMTGGIFNPIKLIDPPDYAGYIFEGYGPLSDTIITVPDVPEKDPESEEDMTHKIELYTTDYEIDQSGHARLAMKLFYSIDPEGPTSTFLTSFTLGKDYNDKYTADAKSTAVKETVSFTITPVGNAPTFANNGAVSMTVTEGVGSVDVTLPTSFTAAGDYWYTITETKGSTAGVTYDTSTYYLHLVTYCVDGEYGVVSAALHTTENGAGTGDAKITTVSNEYGEGTLTVTEKVTFNGEESDDDTAEFTEAVTFTLPANTVITGNVTYVDSEGTKTITPEQWNNGTVSVDITLKNGDSVTFNGLPDGTTYTVSQKTADEAFDLESVVFDNTEDGDTVTSNVANGTIGDPADTVTITNAGFTPLDVGVILENGAFILLALGAIVLAAWLIISKRRREIFDAE